MNVRTARVVSIAIFVAFIAMMVTGLYLQWLTGEILYGGMLTSMPIFILAGFVLAIWVALGGLVVWHYPRNPIGWLMCIWPVEYALSHFSWGIYLVSLETNSVPQAAVRAAVIWQNLSDYPADMVLLGLFFLLFPANWPLSTFWRRFAWIAALAYLAFAASEVLKPGSIYDPDNYPEIINPIGLSEITWRYIQPVQTIFLLVSVAFLFSTGLSLAVRLKRSRGEERQQMKWFAYFALLFLVCAAVILVFERISYSGIWLQVATSLVGFIILGMAVGVTIAIFRYRLYTIDIIIRRTLVYGALTGLLAVVYLASVMAMFLLLFIVTGQQLSLTELGGSRVVWILATLIIAGLFSPLRRRVQAAIDKRFYRERYNAERALFNFSVQARDDVDLEILSEGLLNVINDTFHPEYASLWLLEAGAESGHDAQSFS